jgi:hypothetical protein
VRRAFCRPGCAARCAPATTPLRHLCRAVPHFLEPRAVGSLRVCHPWDVSRIFVPLCTTPSYPTVRHRFSPHASRHRSPYRGIEAGIPSPRLPIKVAQQPGPHSPQLMPAALPVRPSEEPVLRLVRRQPTPLVAPLDLTTYRCCPCSFPNRKLSRAKAAAAVLTVRCRPASCRLFPTQLRQQIDSR